LSEVVEHLDLRTGRFHQLRLLIITRTAPHASYRERFSPMERSGHRPAAGWVVSGAHDQATLGPRIPCRAVVSPRCPSSVASSGDLSTRYQSRSQTP
jgi:hypothetical protein